MRTPMSSHLCTMHREAHAQAMARNQPATQRKAHSWAVQGAVKEMREKLYSKRNTKSTKGLVSEKQRIGGQRFQQIDRI